MLAMRALIIFLTLCTAFGQDSAAAIADKGVEAFRSGRYAEAISAFKRAVSLRPSDPKLHLYLATALVQTWEPSNRSVANMTVAREAENAYLRVLSLTPEDHYALRGLARLAQDQNRFDECRKWTEKALISDPTDADAYYTLGMLTWQQFYPVLTKTRTALGMKLDEEGRLTSAPARKSLHVQFSSFIEDGITNLKKAVALNPDYDDAMAYINLLIRERGQLRETDEEYRADVALAELWVQRALDARKRKALAAAKGFNPRALDGWEFLKSPNRSDDAPGLTPAKLKRMREMMTLSIAGAMQEQQNPISVHILGSDHDTLQIEWEEMTGQTADLLLRGFVSQEDFFNSMRFMNFQALQFSGRSFSRRLDRSDFIGYSHNYEAYVRAVMDNLKRILGQNP
jgi:tetratricopeptide (TPR) repeat protein